MTIASVQRVCGIFFYFFFVHTHARIFFHVYEPFIIIFVLAENRRVAADASGDDDDDVVIIKMSYLP